MSAICSKSFSLNLTVIDKTNLLNPKNGIQIVRCLVSTLRCYTCHSLRRLRLCRCSNWPNNQSKFKFNLVQLKILFSDTEIFGEIYFIFSIFFSFLGSFEHPLIIQQSCQYCSLSIIRITQWLHKQSRRHRSPTRISCCR